MASIFGTTSTTPSVDAAPRSRSDDGDGGCGLFDDTSAQHQRLEEALRAQKRQRTAATVSNSNSSSSYCQQETPSETTLQIRRAQASHPVILEQLTLSARTDDDDTTDSISGGSHGAVGGRDQRDPANARSRDCPGRLWSRPTGSHRGAGIAAVSPGGVSRLGGTPHITEIVQPEEGEYYHHYAGRRRHQHHSLLGRGHALSRTHGCALRGRRWQEVDDTATTAHAPTATSAAHCTRTNHIWETSPLLNSVVQHALRGAAADDPPRLVYAGWIFSFPGAPDQPWHQDGTPLFPTSSSSQSINQQLPPYALNVFVPLQDADGALASGPTEFVVGSHRMDEATAMRAVERHNINNQRKEAATAVVGCDDDDDDDDDLPPIVSPVLQRGDVLIYDYRICHRGTANLTAAHWMETNSSSSSIAYNSISSNHNSANDDNDPNGGGRVRTILYLMYARPWFREHLNFGTERLLPPPSSPSSSSTATAAVVGKAPKPKGQVT